MKPTLYAGAAMACVVFQAPISAAPEAPALHQPPEPARPDAWEKPSGPYAVVVEEEPTLPDHTIYRPVKSRHRLPVVAFAGPGCDWNGTAFRPFFTQLASNGFLVLVSGPPEPRGGSGPEFQKTSASDLTASLDWAQRAARAQGRYRGRIDPDKMAIMGQSCGGLEAMQIASDPRVKTIVLWNSGILNRSAGEMDPTAALPVAVKEPMNLGKDALTKIRVPIAYFVGQTDVARPNAADDFERLTQIPVFFGALDIAGDSHAGTFRQTNGGKFAAAGVAWLKWHLKGDMRAARWFRGPDCILCGDGDWNIRKKKID